MEKQIFWSQCHMFGFMRGSRFDKTYRQVYAQCCDAQRLRFGVSSLLFHSYESILLYVLAVDAGACPAPPDTAVTCCRLRHRPDNWPGFDTDLAKFCSHFALLLATVKLDDDVRDDGSLLARFVRWRFRRRFAAARDYFQSLDPPFQQRLDDVIARHLNLEREAPAELSLDRYVQPTADAFAYFFGLFGSRLPRHGHLQPVLQRIGRSVGSAIISFDCAVDFDRDARQGRFNPLHSVRDTHGALEYALRCLSEIGWECSQAFGADGIASRVARFNFERVARQLSARLRGPSTAQSAPRFRRARRLLRHGFCDCDCGGCDGCDGCGGGGACGGGDTCGGCDAGDALASPPCICDCCWCLPANDCGGKKQADQSQGERQDAPPSTLVGMTGQAAGPLNPTGYVIIAEKRIPARSNGPWIDDGARVKVLSEEPFGVIVHAL